MGESELALRAERAAAALEQSWDRWRTVHGYGGRPVPPVSSYVGYSYQEPWGEPRVVFGIAAEEAEEIAALLDGHACTVETVLRARVAEAEQGYLNGQERGIPDSDAAVADELADALADRDVAVEDGAPDAADQGAPQGDEGGALPCDPADDDRQAASYPADEVPQEERPAASSRRQAATRRARSASKRPRRKAQAPAIVALAPGQAEQGQSADWQTMPDEQDEGAPPSPPTLDEPPGDRATADELSAVAAFRPEPDLGWYYDDEEQAEFVDYEAAEQPGRHTLALARLARISAGLRGYRRGPALG